MTKYAITEGDYNDVFNKYELEFKNYNEAEQYAKSMFEPQYLDKVEDIGSDNICLAIYYPVTDDDGNEISTDDPRYDELNEQQELRIQYYIEVQEIEE
jgi:hypothetical protein